MKFMPRFVLKRKSLLLLILSIGIMQIAGHYLAGALVRSDGGMAIPQTDTLLYCQAAKRIVEGCPLSFSAGTAASTGTTSHAYPFALAVPYLIGFRGDALIRAGFFLNGLFYLVFLLGWGIVIDRRLMHPYSRLVAVITIGFLGQTAYSAFAQSDIGMWLAMSGIIAAGLATGNRIAYGLALVAAPWVRPEGIVCVIALALVLMVLLFLRRRLPETEWLQAQDISRKDVLIAAVAVVSVIGVFGLNVAVSGQVQFSSLAHKGYFKTLPFANAVFATCVDMLKMSKGLLLGLPDGAPRDFYGVPVIGAALMWFAVFWRDWRRTNWREAVWLLAVAGGVLTVAQSGWQNTNVDRYIGWMLPTVLFFSAEGAGAVVTIFGGKPAAWIPGGVNALFVMATAPVFVCMLHMTSVETDLLRAFAVECERVMDRGETVGTWGDCGVAYEMGGRKVAHLGGIYSPEYMVAEPPFGVYEILKNEPATRFCYLIYNPSTDDQGLSFNPLEAFCSQVLVGPFGYELRKVDWSCFDASAMPPAPGRSGLSLVGRVDVGYDRDEKAHAYENLPKYDLKPLPPFVVWGDGNGGKMIESARLVVGSDAMTVALVPGKDLHVVMRTWPTHKTTIRGGFGARSVTYGFSNPLKIGIRICGVDAGVRDVAIGENGFSDVEMTVPGELICKSPARIEFLGDHIACAYWFWQ